MLKGETWLCHSKLWEHFTIERKGWVRNLGWFDRMVHTSSKSTGWIMFGDDANAPSQQTIYPIVAEHGATRKLYKWNGVKWDHIDGPIVLSAGGIIAGVVGAPEVLKENSAQDYDEWHWPGIHVIDVNPTVAAKVHTLPSPLLRYAVNQGLKLYTDSLTTESPEVVAAAPGCVGVSKIGNRTWLVDTGKIKMGTAILEVGFDVRDLRHALATMQHQKLNFAWVSDSRAWPGWFPDNDTELTTIHLFPDSEGQYGGEMFMPIGPVLTLVSEKGTLNDYPDLKFHDRQV
jgi:hypothetical protein